FCVRDQPGVEIAQIVIPDAHFAQWMYSGSGSHLAMFAKTDRLLQWDAPTGRELSSQTITGADRLLALGDGGQALLKAGDQLKLVGVDGQVLTLPDSFQAGNDVMVRLETVGGHQALLYAMPGSPIQCWNIPEMTLRWELPWTVPDRGELHWNTVHQRLAYIDRQGVIHLWDIPTLSKLGTYQGHAGRPDFCWFEDGSSFVTILRHHELKIWQADRSRESQLVWTGNPGESYGLICGSENGTVAAFISSRKIGVWPAPHAPPVELEIQTSNIKAHRLTPDGKAVVLATRDGTLALWDAATGQLQRSIVKTPSPATAILCDPQLRWIATTHTGNPGKTSIWSLEGQLLAELQVSPPLALNKDATLLIGCKNQGHGLILINTQDWAVDNNHPLLSTNSRIFAMDAATQADRVVVAEQSGKVHLMDIAQRQVLRTLQPYGNQSVSAVALTPNGKRVAFSGSGRLTLWDTATGTMVLDLSPSATIDISHAFFTRQGRQLVVRDRKQLRGWDNGQ
ncbi:MAG: WD40 repeat domain-containing protein, partial [Phycisphaerales bacterium]|nr:WD40 repeat domain-containing protein [Phycisphaerales bacterium]